MMRHLIIRLQAPMMAFCTVRVDRYGRTLGHPGLSMMTGLLANALGYERSERERLQRLQDRVVFASRIDREAGETLREYQTVEIRRGEQAWTPLGIPERRGGGEYQRHFLYQEYHQDMTALAALRLEPKGEEPGLDDLAAALDRPERPLFIGRKCCPPAERLMAGWAEGDTALEALLAWPAEDNGGMPERIRLSWPPDEGAWGIEPEADRRLADVRNWQTGTHGGERRIMTGTVPRERLPAASEAGDEE